MQILEKFQETRHKLAGRKRRGIAGLIVGIAIALILFATIGIIALQILATAGSTSFQPSVVTMVFVVIPIVAAVAVIVGFLKLAGVRI